MIVALASDHAGLKIKNSIIDFIKTQKIDIIDCGCYDDNPIDYVDKGLLATNLLIENKCHFAILICGTGIGMSIIANKVNGIRAALCHTKELARLSREHNDANVLALAGRFLSESTANEIVSTFLHTEFSNDLRHMVRIQKIHKYENREVINEESEKL